MQVYLQSDGQGWKLVNKAGETLERYETAGEAEEAMRVIYRKTEKSKATRES